MGNVKTLWFCLLGVRSRERNTIPMPVPITVKRPDKEKRSLI
jgi:hypothetical protein